jgi:uncharacterized protein (AIM24 family)
MQDRVVEAKAELERALRDKPQDARSQDLLAGVYFRLGVYPRAIEIWSQLVAAYPGQAALRVNLGLALFKTGQADEAKEQLRAALKLEADHERAWGYLGLVEWRLGHFEQARDAFLRGGQASMAHRMEEELGASSAGHYVAPKSGLGEQERRDISLAAAGALDAVDADSLQVEGGQRRRRSTGRWNAVEIAREALPSLPPLAPDPASRQQSTTRALERVMAWPDARLGLTLSPSGELLIAAEDTLCSRLEGLVAVSGELRTVGVDRTGRGPGIAGNLGGKTPLFRWHGPVSALLSPPPSTSFELFQLEPGDPLFVRESVLFAFVDSVRSECAILPLGREPLVVAQLRGEGAVALVLERPLTGFRVEADREARVDPARVVGWSGRLFPRGARGTAPYSAGAPPLCFRGDGLLLLG